MALSGAAVVRMRSMACSMLSVILLVPMNRTTCSGPKVMPDTRFPTMSTLTSWPWRVRAFVPVTNKSARRAWRRQYVFLGPAVPFLESSDENTFRSLFDLGKDPRGFHRFRISP